MKDKVDRSVLGAIGGFVGGIVIAVCLKLPSFFIAGTYPKIINIANLFIPKGLEHTLSGTILAYIAHFIISSLLGVFFINFFRITGRDWATTKGLIFGATVWVVLYGVFGQLLRIPLKVNITASYIVLISHLIFGIATSWSILWLSERAKL